jgi:DNA-binding response OmpR family regulator
MTANNKVLIVEDEPIVGLALEDMLESLGWVVIGVAARVQQGLNMIQTTAPAFAILDVNLHGEQSYPIADALADRGVPYIFATGYGDTAHPVLAPAGAHTHKAILASECARCHSSGDRR